MQHSKVKDFAVARILGSRRGAVDAEATKEVAVAKKPDAKAATTAKATDKKPDAAPAAAKK